MPRIFYTGTPNGSSWSMRAWLALCEAGVVCDQRLVDIRRPQRFANLAAIAEFSPPGAVPVLVDDGDVIFDSLAIMEYANDLYFSGAAQGDVYVWLVSGGTVPLDLGRTNKKLRMAITVYRIGELSASAPKITIAKRLQPLSCKLYRHFDVHPGPST